MSRDSKTYRVGDVTVTRIDELTLNVFPQAMLYPGSDPTTLGRHKDKLGSGVVDAENGNLILSTHSWLLKTLHRAILIDTATGNDKARPYAPIFDQLKVPYLDRLVAAGIQPDDIDLVVFTHLHADHVGWNTSLVDGRWVPTFRNAKHVFSKLEQSYNEKLAEGRNAAEAGAPAKLGTAVGQPFPGVFDDSVRPVIEAGLCQAVAIDGSEIAEGLSLLPSPGHSVDHASIRLVSRGEEALFSGDVMHHPLQVYEPGLNSCFCEFPEAALRSRTWALEHAAERKAKVFTTHFTESSVGSIERKGNDFTWRFI
jgi:glyoxylase-like metal-dependent hydrolase (beta-lactamase superfamily II)